VVLAQRTIDDIPTACIALVTLGILWKTRKIPEPVLVLAAAILGLILYPLVS
jgi:chromate transporter